MKKIYNILALLLIAFTFGGCTLSMEEWLDEPATGEVPEEKRGVDAPYTETIPDVITVTYKYNPGVRPVTTKHRGYLAYVEADTILYFYDNMPKELLPLEGEYLAAGCAPQFPDGLNHRVLTVERAGGLYKVVMTKATIDEVYDDLVYELDVAYNPPLNDYMDLEDTTQVEYSNGNSEPEIIQDWTLYNEVKGLSDADAQYIKRANARSRTRARNRALTRAEYANDKDTATSWGFEYKFDYAKGAAPKDLNWHQRIFHYTAFNYVELNKRFFRDGAASFYLEVSYNNSTTVRGYSMVNKNEKYEKTYTETTETQKLGLAVGVDYGHRYTAVGKQSDFLATNGVPIDKVNKQYIDDYLKGLKEVTKKNNRLKEIGFKFIIPCAIPVTMVFKFGFDIEWNINGNLAAYWEKEVVTIKGYEYNNKVKKPIEDKIIKPDKYSIVGSGSATLSLIPTASVGVQVSGTLGADLGIEGTWKLIDLNAKLGYNFGLEGDIYTEASLSSSFVVNPFARFYVSPFGWELWEHKIKFSKNWSIYNTKNPINPQLYISEVPGKIDAGTDEVSLNYCYGVTKTGIGLSNHKLRPRLALFKNEIKDANLIAHVEPDDISTDEAIKSTGAYWFDYEFDDNNPYDANNKYIAVPALYNPDAESYIYYTNNGYVYQTAVPKMKIVGIAQESATKASSDYNFSDEADLIEYKFAVELDASATKVAKDYGIAVSIPKLGIDNHKISLKKHTMYNSMTNVVSVSFFTDYVAEAWVLKIKVCPYVVNDKGSYSFGKEESLEIGYPMEYKKYTSDKRSPTQINATIE